MMTEQRVDTDSAAPQPGKDSYGLSPEQVDAVVKALEAGERGEVLSLVSPLRPADCADLIERLEGDRRALLVDIIHPEFNPEILAELDETVREQVLDRLSNVDVAAAVSILDTDDAVHILEDLDEEDRQEVIEALPVADRLAVTEALSYPEESAGRLMQRELVAVPAYWTVGQTIDFLRETDELPDEFYDLFVVDADHRPIGTIPLNRLLRTRRPVTVGELMESDLTVIPAALDQEEVAFIFRQHDLVSAPVADAGGRLVGVITHDDIVDVIHEEAEEDILRLGGVSETDLYSPVADTTRARFSWLLVNLATAVAASIVIGFFRDTLEAVVALAVLMPIVASMGGNAGTQSLTVAVRAIAMKELDSSNAFRVLRKEISVGLINGLLFAVLAGLISWFWFDNWLLGLIMGIAMILNLVMAGLAGTAIPVLLNRLGIDPAVSSSVFLTTVTDIVGFFAFLGLAAWILF